VWSMTLTSSYVENPITLQAKVRAIQLFGNLHDGFLAVDSLSRSIFIIFLHVLRRIMEMGLMQNSTT